MESVQARTIIAKSKRATKNFFFMASLIIAIEMIRRSGTNRIPAKWCSRINEL